MCKVRYFVVLTALIGRIVWPSLVSADDAGWVRVSPKETDEILANPGMGRETFHRTADDDKNLPAWIPSTIHYARWGWGTLEPEKGKIDYGFLDGVLEETRESGQQLAFRVMCCSPYPRRPYHPEWLRDIDGEIIKTKHGDRTACRDCQAPLSRQVKAPSPSLPSRGADAGTSLACHRAIDQAARRAAGGRLQATGGGVAGPTSALLPSDPKAILPGLAGGRQGSYGAGSRYPPPGRTGTV